MFGVKRANNATTVKELIAYVNGLASDKDGSKDGSKALLANSYAAELKNADKQQSRWRQIYYESRGFVIVASAVITVLAALNLHGGAAFAIRGVTLGLSALVTVLTGLLELLQVNHRWRLYRQLRSTLENVGWRTAMDGGATPAESLTDLGNGLVAAMRDFETRYISEVATDGSTDSADTKASKRRKPETAAPGTAGT
jgi:hypothetical protein